MKELFKKTEEELFALCKEYQEEGGGILNKKKIVSKAVELSILYEAMTHENDEEVSK